MNLKKVSLLLLALCFVWSASVEAHKPDPRAKTDGKVRPWSPRKDCSGVYGASEKAKAQKVGLGELLKNTAKYKGKYVEVSGVVRDVCRVKGCWLMLQDGKHLMRVRFKGYKFFVPTNSKGYRVSVWGYGRKSMLSVRMARHYAEESENKAAAAKITKPQQVVAFTASFVKLSKATSSSSTKK